MSARLVATAGTLEDGKFSFKNVAAGEYELRGSKDGWSRVSVRFRVAPRAREGSRKRIEIPMSLAV